MPRTRHKLGGTEPSQHPALVAELANELVQTRDFGQPWIEELIFPATDRMRVTVIWDKWEPLPDLDRVAVIRQAYEEVEGAEFRDRIGLAMGLTVPEAYEYGKTPVRIIPVVRKSDPVTLDECRKAMIGEGASLLLDPTKPLLCFATEEQAEACRQRLVRRLPKSEAVWLISTEMAQIA